MFKLLHNCTHLTGFKIDAQSSESETSTVCEMRTSRCSSWIYKRQRNQRSNCQHPLDHWKSKRVPEKHLLLLYWLCQSFTMWITTHRGKFLKRRESQTSSPASWEICMEVKKKQLKSDTGQQIGSILGKEYIKTVYSHPVYLTYM